MNQAMLRSRLTDVLQTLDYREREILRLRYGLTDGCPATLREIGRIFFHHPGAGPPDRGRGDRKASAS